MAKRKRVTKQVKDAPTKEALGMIEPLKGKLRIDKMTKGSKDRLVPVSDSLAPPLRGIYEDFLRGYDELSIPGQNQLASFISSSLAAQKSFKGLDLLKFQRVQKRIPQEAYDFGTKKISIHPGGKLNPILKFIHEGTHALDDLSMKVYQKDAIDSLAEILKKTSIDKDKGTWYKKAQGILPSREFRDYYPYISTREKTDVRRNIKDSFYNLNIPEGGRTQEIMDFQKAKQALAAMKTPDSDLFTTLSEFPAYAMEGLFSPWTVTSTTDQNAKRFLYNIMQGVHNGFNKLGLNQGSYPLVTEAFDRRMRQLGRTSLPLTVPKTDSSSSYSSGYGSSSSSSSTSSNNPSSSSSYSPQYGLSSSSSSTSSNNPSSFSSYSPQYGPSSSSSLQLPPSPPPTHFPTYTFPLTPIPDFPEENDLD